MSVERLAATVHYTRLRLTSTRTASSMTPVPNVYRVNLLAIGSRGSYSPFMPDTHNSTGPTPGLVFKEGKKGEEKIEFQFTDPGHFKNDKNVSVTSLQETTDFTSEPVTWIKSDSVTTLNRISRPGIFDCACAS